MIYICISQYVRLSSVDLVKKTQVRLGLINTAAFSLTVGPLAPLLLARFANQKSFYFHELSCLYATICF